MSNPQIPYLWVYTADKKSLIAGIYKRLQRLGYTVEGGNGWMLGKPLPEDSAIPILMVAHIDTVHSRPPLKDEVVYENDVLSAPEVGIGADDRAGVAGIMEILFRGFRPYVLFTDLEEVGCVGARNCASELKEIPPVRYMIELDRMNGNDCVFYDCDSPDFTKYVESFGFKHAIGSWSDVGVLMKAWGIAGVNLSIGYYGQHSKTERVKMTEWWKTLARVGEMLKVPPETKFEFIEKVYARFQDAEELDRIERLWALGYKAGNTRRYKPRTAIYIGDFDYTADLIADYVGIGTEEFWEEVLVTYKEDIVHKVEEFFLDTVWDFGFKLMEKQDKLKELPSRKAEVKDEQS